MSNEKKKAPKEETLIATLETWVAEHPEFADVPHINITTWKEFTIRGILNDLINERDTGVKIVDADVLEIKNEVKKWLGA
jgi:hypothetical protein